MIPKIHPAVFVTALAVASWACGQDGADRESELLKRENERLHREVERLTKQVREFEKQREFFKTALWSYAAFTAAFIDEDPAVRKWAVKSLVKYCMDPKQVKTHLDGLTSKEKDQSVLDVAVKAYNEFLEKQKEGQPDKPQ